MNYRIEKDSMGEIKVPADAYYSAQTQRAVENFPISGKGLDPHMIKAMGLVKLCAAKANFKLGLIPSDIHDFIVLASQEVMDGKFNAHFPIDVFQTGSGTSSNMNANEVIAKRANELAKRKK